MQVLTFRPGRTTRALLFIGLAAGFAISKQAAATGGGAMGDGLLALLGGGLLFGGFVLLRKKRLIENVACSRIRSVAMGFSEIVGAARERVALRARLTGAPCVYFEFRIEEERSDGKRRKWVTIDEGRSAEPFELDDGTGRIVVDPRGADTVLREAYRKVIRGEGWFGRRQRHTEWRLIPGQRVYVLGTVAKIRDEAEESRADLRERLRHLKADPERMKELDADGDGAVSDGEWGAAVEAVKSGMLRENLERAVEAPAGNLVIGKGTAEATFVIADRPEGSLVRNLSFKVAGALGGGFLLLMLGAVSLLARARVLPPMLVIPWE